MNAHFSILEFSALYSVLFDAIENFKDLKPINHLIIDLDYFYPQKYTHFFDKYTLNVRFLGKAACTNSEIYFIFKVLND